MRLCEIEGCEARHEARGLCKKHWYRLQRHGTTDDPKPPVVRLCEIPGCERPRRGRGLCQMHLHRLRRNGDPYQARNYTSTGYGSRFGPDEYQRAWRREKFYRLTPDAYAALLASQGGGCAVCGDAEPTRGFQIDHDHGCCDFDPTQVYRSTCGECVRGILCATCNATDGRFSDPELVTAWSRYIDRYRSNHKTARVA